jgi:hypothetical protein
MSSVRSESNQFSITPSSPNQKVKLTKKQKLIILLRIGLMLFIEIALPIILYYVLRGFMPEIWALAASGAPPLLVVIYGLIRKRRIDMFGVILIISLTITAIVSSLTKDARINLLRECAVTGAIGLTHLITLIPIKIGSFQVRPLSYYFARDIETGGSFSDSSSKRNNTGLSDEIIDRFERNWNNYAVFRRGYRVLSALWGVSFILQVPIQVVIIFNSTIERAFFWTNIVTYIWLGVLIIIDISYSRWFKKRMTKGEPTAVSQISI